MEPMDLLADTRQYIASAIKQLEAINAGAPIAEPVTREQAINIVTSRSAFLRACCVDMDPEMPADPKGEKRPTELRSRQQRAARRPPSWLAIGDPTPLRRPQAAPAGPPARAALNQIGQLVALEAGLQSDWRNIRRA